MSAIAKTVLIVDDDFAFAFWLGRILTDAGYQVWPARSATAAAALLKDLRVRLDLLVINPNAPDAAAFIEDQRRRTDFKTVFVQQDEGTAVAIDRVDAVVAKPRHPDELAALEWKGIIERVLAK